MTHVHTRTHTEMNTLHDIIIEHGHFSFLSSRMNPSQTDDLVINHEKSPGKRKRKMVYVLRQKLHLKNKRLGNLREEVTLAALTPRW